MGGGRKPKRQRDQGTADRSEGAAGKDPRDNKRNSIWKSGEWKDDNNNFVRFYGPEGLNLLKLIGRDESEWPKMLAALRTPLPSTFRVSPVGNFEKRTVRSLQQHVANIVQKTTFPVIDPETNEVIASGPPQPAGQWCPEAWTSGTYRSGLKSSAPFRDLHRFLVRASDTGAVSRQELVSMIPAIMLDVKPGNWVLDMCAAPGSKSLQILEVLEKGNNGGVLVANDVDARRAYMLTKRTKNLKSASLVVSTHDATQFPVQRRADGSPLFDRVLCDVPCSGDGTLRKNVGLWKALKVKDGMGLHPTQVRIASKAIHCLKVGGMFVYSTCSFNPVEDEAVVCEILKSFPGEVELLDTAEQMLPGLIRAPGLSKPWKIPIQRSENDPIHYFSTFEEYQSWNTAHENPLPEGVVKPSMFPPENLESFNLERCVRLLPHDQDSGGFFVAAFRKVKDAAAEKRLAAIAAKSAVEAASSSSAALLESQGTESAGIPKPEQAKSRKPAKNNKNDVWYEEITQETWDAIREEWGIEGVGKELFQVRMDNRAIFQQQQQSGGAPTNPLPAKISWINRDVLELFELSTQKSLHIVHAGVLAFQRGKGSTYRIANDYASMFLPYVTKRVAEIGFRELKELYEFLESKGFIQEREKEEGELEDADDASEEEETKQEEKKNQPGFDANILVASLNPSQASYLKTIPEGGIILKLNAPDQDRFAEEIGGTFAAAAWWGNKTLVRLMVDQSELVELLVQLRDAKLI